MVIGFFNATFNNLSVISWLSVLLAEDIQITITELTQVTDQIYHITLYWFTLNITYIHEIINIKT